jgi:hypothetical protein
MSLLWERKNKGISRYLIDIPIIIFLVIINIVLITWFFHLLYCLFSDLPEPMSLLKWAEHLSELVKRFIDQILYSISVRIYAQ